MHKFVKENIMSLLRLGRLGEVQLFSLQHWASVKLSCGTLDKCQLYKCSMPFWCSSKMASQALYCKYNTL